MEYWDEIAPCACGKGYVIRHMSCIENDWSPDIISEDSYGITCPDCQQKYHREGSGNFTYLVPNDEAVNEKTYLNFKTKEGSCESDYSRRLRLAIEALGKPLTYKFCKVGKQDLKSLIELRGDFLGIGGFLKAAVETPDMVKDKDLAIYIAYVNEKIPHDKEIGYIIMKYIDDENGVPNYAQVQEIYTAPHFRQKGIASELLDKCINAAKRRKIGNIKLDYSTRSVLIREFCKAAGFETKVVQTEKRI